MTHYNRKTFAASPCGVCMVARWEHRTRTLSKLFGSPSLACYCLGFIIILLNVSRSH
ncbi:hypothetical protein JOQ06_026993, partial [Pogonophryne albipinna]